MKLGMGSAPETLCGDIYMQGLLVILLATTCLLVPVYVWSPSILGFFDETT
ncbi:hypothetical protein LINPERHAP2_LOCUS35490 [Linum perenne]